MIKHHIGPSRIHGTGFFVDEFIPAGTRIIEYVGERISREEEARRERENDKTGVTYIFVLNQDTCIDGAVGGNDSIFVNHSCEPNIEHRYEDGRIFYYALQDIFPGTELFLDYRFDPNGKIEPCRCGSPNCRGFMNDLRPREKPARRYPDSRGFHAQVEAAH